MLELVTGVIVAIAAVALVIEPLFSARAVPAGTGPPPDELTFENPEESESPRVRALLALKEIEFDRATGKLSEEDYLILKRQYGRAALEAMDDAPPAPETAATGDDVVEQAVAAFKNREAQSCPDCGDRPEPAAVFCSSCGRALGTPDAKPRCWECGADLEDEARFCGGCGVAVTA